MVFCVVGVGLAGSGLVAEAAPLSAGDWLEPSVHAGQTEPPEQAEPTVEGQAVDTPEDPPPAATSSDESDTLEPAVREAAEVPAEEDVPEAEPSTGSEVPSPAASVGQQTDSSPAASVGRQTDSSPAASVGEQMDPSQSALPARDEETQLRLKLDAIELEKLYEAVREQVTREKQAMRLEECVRMALEGNQDILITQYTPMQADADLFASRGEFDPVLSGNATYVRTEQSLSAETQTYVGSQTVISSIEAFNTSGQAAVNGKLHWGTTYRLSLDMSKEETTYNRFIEEYSGAMTLGLSQPLLRGRGRPANLARVRAAKNARLQAGDQFIIQVTSAIAEVVKAYWDLVGATENVKVSQESLANAERLLEINESLYAHGKTAALEVVKTKASVASRQSELISARSRVLDAMDNLKNLVGITRDDPLASTHIVPVDRPSLRQVELNEDASIARALDNRPEVRSAELAVQTAEIERKRAGNDLLPELDVTGSVTQGGRGHYMTDVFDGIQERQDRSYTVGVQGSLPIRNRATRGAYQRAQFELRASQQQLVKTKQEVTLAARLAVRGAATNRILVESNKQARALQETNVAAEEKRLRLGVSTSFEVLRTQEDLAAAQLQELQAMIAYEKALVDVSQAEGILLQELGVEIDLPEAPRPVSFIRSIFPPAPH